MQQVDARMTTIDLNGRQIINDCKEMIHLLKEKLSEIKQHLLSHPLETESDEVQFFKYYKPTLLGRLLYFYKILRIESQRPVDESELDEYYQKQQGELKRFFDRHLPFFQYYRSGATHMDSHYFLRGRQESVIDVDVCPFDDNPEFSTGYDHLVARIISMEMLYAFLSHRRTCLQGGNSVALMQGSYRWTGSIIELAELIYGLDEMKCINNGDTSINELAAFVGAVLGVDIKDCYSAYVDMKRRKDDSRTYFLDKMRERLNQRMERDEDKERKRKK